MMRKKEAWRTKYPAKLPLKSKCDCWTASKWEKRAIHSRPGIYHLSMDTSSGPVCSSSLIQVEQKRIRTTKTTLIKRLIRKEEEAIAVFSELSRFALTNRIWAFLSNPLFVASKMVMEVRKMAHVPYRDLSDGSDSARIRIIKLVNPKKAK